MAWVHTLVSACATAVHMRGAVPSLLDEGYVAARPLEHEYCKSEHIFTVHFFASVSGELFRLEKVFVLRAVESPDWRYLTLLVYLCILATNLVNLRSISEICNHTVYLL